MREFWMRLMSLVVIVGLILGYNSVLEARAKDEEMIVTQDESGDIKIKLKTPLKGVTPGQVCVFYQGDICLGSGIIK